MINENTLSFPIWKSIFSRLIIFIIARAIRMRPESPKGFYTFFGMPKLGTKQYRLKHCSNMLKNGSLEWANSSILLKSSLPKSTEITWQLISRIWPCSKTPCSNFFKTHMEFSKILIWNIKFHWKWKLSFRIVMRIHTYLMT